MANHECCGGHGHEGHHHHGEGECCGGHGHGHAHYPTVVISLDGETDINCNVLGNFDVAYDGVEREYVALQPIDEEEVLIFRYEETDGDVKLDNIESDEEYNAVAEVFYGIFDDEDFDGEGFEEFFDDEDFDEDDSDEDDEEDSEDEEENNK